MKRFLSRTLLVIVVVGATQSAATAQPPQASPFAGPPPYDTQGPVYHNLGQMLATQGQVFATQLNHVFPGRLWTNLTVVPEEGGMGFDTGGYFSLGGKTRLGEDYFGGRWLVESRLHLSYARGGFFGNFGLERVFTIDPAKTDVGVSLWYDYDADTVSTNVPVVDINTWRQVSVGAYLRNEAFTVRVNGYIPVGPTGSAVGRSPNGCLTTALEGFDAEIRFYPFNWEMFRGTLDLGGYYYRDDDELMSRFRRRGENTVAGFRGRVSVQTMWGVLMQLEVDHDAEYDTTGFLRFVFTTGPFGDYDPLGRDLDPSIRNDHVIKVIQCGN